MGRVARSLKHGWNIFTKPKADPGFAAGPSYTHRPNRSASRYYSDKSIIASIYTRMSIDVSLVEFFHAKLDEHDVVSEIVHDNLNDCLSLNPNIDQNAQAFKQDLAMTLFEQGVVAIVPTDANLDPSTSSSYDIRSLRVGRIVAWFPRRVTVEVYDDREVDDNGDPVNGGVVKQVTVEKKHVAIVENPFYNVMNEPSGTLQRLIRKLSLLDGMDEAAGSGKLDIIFQLPYVVRGESRQMQAEKRRRDLANQLKDDELGVGYIDASEKVIQLNRGIDNKLLGQIEVLYEKLYSQLGLTQSIMDGTASRDTLNNYFDRTIEPIANAVALEFKRKFLTKTARTQKHSIEIYRDPLKLIPIEELAEVSDKLIRNAIITTNELRPKIGFRPSTDPMANELRNPNMPMDDQQEPSSGAQKKKRREEDENERRRLSDDELEDEESESGRGS